MTPKKGHVFHGPNGQGYRVTRDCAPATLIRADDFEPFGGAERLGSSAMVPLAMFPPWMAAQMQALQEKPNG